MATDALTTDSPAPATPASTLTAAPGGRIAALRPGDIWARPMPGRAGRFRCRCVIRGLLMVFGGRFLELRGLEQLETRHDPFILALNHSQRLEALFIPALFGFLRGGRMVQFIADWNFLLIPGISSVYAAGDVIVLDRKPARPRFLNVLRPWLTPRTPAFERAAALLREGGSVGVFPEGTTNPDARRLLRGFSGVARLSLQTGAPVVPAGVRFPNHRGEGPIRELERMVIEIGPPMAAPERTESPNRRLVHEWHGAIMREIARLSGKEWHAGASRKKA